MEKSARRPIVAECSAWAGAGPGQISPLRGLAPAPVEMTEGGGLAPAPVEMTEGGGLAPAPVEMTEGGGLAPAPVEMTGRNRRRDEFRKDVRPASQRSAVSASILRWNPWSAGSLRP